MLPIIMCTWKRSNGFADTIDMLNKQKDRNFELYVWNNNITQRNTFETAAKKARFKVHFYHSENNIGGFGRFYSAKSLYEKGEKYCVFIDDDHVFGENTVATFRGEAAPKSISSQYGWRFKSKNYYDRYQPKPGESVDYAGTGGMVADASIFASPVLYACPEQYWFIEDLWLSYCAKTRLGYSLVRSSAEMWQTEDEHSLHGSLGYAKMEMLEGLVDSLGFKITG